MRIPKIPRNGGTWEWEFSQTFLGIKSQKSQKTDGFGSENFSRYFWGSDPKTSKNFLGSSPKDTKKRRDLGIGIFLGDSLGTKSQRSQKIEALGNGNFPRDSLGSNPKNPQKIPNLMIPKSLPTQNSPKNFSMSRGS